MELETAGELSVCDAGLTPREGEMGEPRWDGDLFDQPSSKKNQQGCLLASPLAKVTPQRTPAYLKE